MSPCADLIATFCDHLQVEQERSPRTVEHRRAVLTKADRELPSGLEATREEIQAWLHRASQRGRPLSANARAAYWAALTGFYAHVVGLPGGLDHNPMADLPRPRQKTGRPRPLTHDQLRRILTEAANPYRLWTLLAAGLGARCIEISRLDRDDVQPEVTWLHGKGDKHRTVTTHPAVYAAVSALPAGPVARTRHGEQATAHYISGMASAYFHRIGMPGVALHRARHWYATHVQRAAGDIRVTQELLGHASPRTTALYTEVAYEAKRAAVEALPLPRVA